MSSDEEPGPDGLPSDSPGDVERKVERMFGFVEDVDCVQCGRERPVRKMNVHRVEVEDAAGPTWAYGFFCEECKQERLRLVADAFWEEIENDPALADALEQGMARDALWSDDPELRTRAADALRRFLEARGEPGDAP